MLFHQQFALSCPLCGSIETIFFHEETKQFRHQYHLCNICDLVFADSACYLDIDAEKARYDMHNNDYSNPYIDFLCV